MLLLFHNRLRIWLQPGGHVEPCDHDGHAAARREVKEETDASLFSSDRPQLVGVDVHEIPAAHGEPMHLHHDLVFRLVAQSDEIRVSQESRAVIWCPVENLAQYQAEDALRDTVGRAMRMG
jgi:ADP-ribose pyrophosphatase YjhB (NUDIX family)